MEQLTAEGLKVVNDFAQRYGFSQEAVIQMMFAMLKGRGRMAQFSHPEFAGSGQWMAGGMLMLGDMFNHALKARVDGLCQAIAGLLASQPELFPGGSFQAQSQSGGGQQQQTGLAGMTPMGSMPPMAPMTSTSGSLFVADPRDTWWPEELGSPSATGAQNDMRYAYFPDSGRLAVQVNGQVSLYDAGEHRIGGFSQQQGGGGGVVFSTPAGVVSLSSLAAVSGAVQQAQNSGTGSQQQSSSTGGGHQMQFSGGGMAPMGGMRPMAPMTPMTFGSDPGGTWWPSELGSPSATGAQNDVRYAHFADSGRLAVEVNGQLAVYDTRDQAITGLAQQGSGGALVFSTPGGTVSLASLPKLPLPCEPQAREATAAAEPAGQQPSTATSDVLSALERLGELQRKGILTEEEFAAKKADLLSRL
jgi:hypothetical protein